MKHSNHSPSPPSPVSRKLRSDSKLAALPPGDQSLLLQKLETLSYQETASWLQVTHGFCVSPSNLSTFRSRHLENEALKQAYLQAAVFNSTLQDLQEMDPGDEQVEAAVRRLFLFKIVGQGDLGTYLQFTRLGNESKKLALTQARQERLQQQRQDAPGGFEDEDPFNSRNLDPSPLLSPLPALHPNSGPSTPSAPDPIGAGTSRPGAMPRDSKLAPAGHPRPCPNAPCFDPAIPPVRPGDLLDSFQQALDAVMPLDGTEPVPPSRLDPFYATIIGTVIGRMLDVIQSGKFPFTSASSSAAAPPAPVPPPPSAASPDSVAEPSSASASAPLSPSSPSNSLKYPKTSAIPNTAFSRPDRPAPCPTSAGDSQKGGAGFLLANE